MMKTNILKFTIVALAVLLISSSAFGQFTVRAWGGYGIQTGKNQLHSYAQNDLFPLIFEIEEATDLPMYTNISSPGGQFRGEIVRGSYGAGANTGLAVGYQFTDVISAEIGASHLFGRKIESVGDFSEFGLESYKNTSSTNMFFLKPTVTLTAPFEKVRPYLRMGAAIGLAPKVKTEASITGDGLDIIYKDEVRGGVAVGYTSAIGIEVSLSEMVSIFGEAEYNAISYSPNKREVTEVTSNGKDFLKEVYENGTVHSLVNNTPLSYDPFTDLNRKKANYAMSNLSFNMGIKFAFGNPVNSPRGR